MEEVVPVARLGRLGELLGAGGQGRVFDAPGLHLPDAPGSLVYKEYKSVPQSGYGLRRLVKIRNGLDPDARGKLDQRTAWPVRVVEDADLVCGVVMPRIPDSYLQKRMLPGTGKIEDGIREVQNLLIPPARALRVGMPVPTPNERFMICRDFAAALHLVHKNGLVVGDLSARNGLYRLDERPSVMLVDCDAIRVRGTMAAMAQLNSPDWDPPERMLTQSSDRYKFGLFVLRCLSTGEQISTTRDPSRADAALNAEGRRLLRDALSPAREGRTTAQAWGVYFDSLLTGRRSVAGVQPPTVPAQSRVRDAGGWARDPVSGRWKAL